MGNREEEALKRKVLVTTIIEVDSEAIPAAKVDVIIPITCHGHTDWRRASILAQTSFTPAIDRVARAGTKIGTLLSIGSSGNSLLYHDVLIDLGENCEGGPAGKLY